MENRLKHHREGRGWSQGELARQLGVSRQTINAVEQARDARRINRTARHLDLLPKGQLR